jgi:hypothetical protein
MNVKHRKGIHNKSISTTALSVIIFQITEKTGFFLFFQQNRYFTFLVLAARSSDRDFFIYAFTVISPGNKTATHAKR